eukprot:g20183.t1
MQLGLVTVPAEFVGAFGPHLCRVGCSPADLKNYEKKIWEAIEQDEKSGLGSLRELLTSMQGGLQLKDDEEIPAEWSLVSRMRQHIEDKKKEC